jgi:hypothetical protein
MRTQRPRGAACVTSPCDSIARCGTTGSRRVNDRELHPPAPSLPQADPRAGGEGAAVREPGDVTCAGFAFGDHATLQFS